jgi:8-oxo-dGTP pyrophosphatase MutT (NUDIX family)
MVERWEKISGKLLADHRILRVRQDRSRSPRTGAEHDFIVLEMANWINIVPVTEEGRVVMIRQYRHGTGEVGLEIPGGVIDAGEDPLIAARRELREETGYVAEEIAAIGQVAPNPAIQDNRCYSFLAQGAYREGGQELDAGEDIEVVEIEQREIPQLIETGEINHGLVVVALRFAGVY